MCFVTLVCIERTKKFIEGYKYCREIVNNTYAKEPRSDDHSYNDHNDSQVMS